ncbi:uncharacterized protein LOC118405914 isoform X1 [Branchiostoma floridae]|uniref:Uncharacterized protein LOC118405914 isoform X1 n=1 Tax=Branchiostoma floridae TaxID=7739 RepID=A0A9J7KIZ9_BRAFL|nr:uncharacterized protein LOC118405914 isoform X1 [Branchiostoma floridae]XP_035661665.1 uncharacterized protein LOC118405914 isoform X1 [Branchiostoma floridae]XP_035661673.1 uncharacterized protein LOC118405914 isoform X1 [Branchiostoma floridae]
MPSKGDVYMFRRNYTLPRIKRNGLALTPLYALCASVFPGFTTTELSQKFMSLGTTLYKPNGQEVKEINSIRGFKGPGRCCKESILIPITDLNENYSQLCREYRKERRALLNPEEEAAKDETTGNGSISTGNSNTNPTTVPGEQQGTQEGKPKSKPKSSLRKLRIDDLWVGDTTPRIPLTQQQSPANTAPLQTGKSVAASSHTADSANSSPIDDSIVEHRDLPAGVATNKNTVDQVTHKENVRERRPSSQHPARHIGSISLSTGKKIDVVRRIRIYVRARSITSAVPGFNRDTLKKLCCIFGLEWFIVNTAENAVMKCFEEISNRKPLCPMLVRTNSLLPLFSLLAFLEEHFSKVESKQRPTMMKAIETARAELAKTPEWIGAVDINGHSVTRVVLDGKVYFSGRQVLSAVPNTQQPDQETSSESDTNSVMRIVSVFTTGIEYVLGPPAVLKVLDDTTSAQHVTSNDFWVFKVGDEKLFHTVLRQLVDGRPATCLPEAVSATSKDQSNRDVRETKRYAGTFYLKTHSKNCKKQIPCAPLRCIVLNERRYCFLSEVHHLVPHKSKEDILEVCFALGLRTTSTPERIEVPGRATLLKILQIVMGLPGDQYPASVQGSVDGEGSSCSTEESPGTRVLESPSDLNPEKHSVSGQSQQHSDEGFVIDTCSSRDIPDTGSVPPGTGVHDMSHHISNGTSETPVGVDRDACAPMESDESVYDKPHDFDLPHESTNGMSSETPVGVEGDTCEPTEEDGSTYGMPYDSTNGTSETPVGVEGDTCEPTEEDGSTYGMPYDSTNGTSETPVGVEGDHCEPSEENGSAYGMPYDSTNGMSVTPVGVDGDTCEPMETDGSVYADVMPSDSLNGASQTSVGVGGGTCEPMESDGIAYDMPHDPTNGTSETPAGLDGDTCELIEKDGSVYDKRNDYDMPHESTNGMSETTEGVDRDACGPTESDRSVNNMPHYSTNGTSETPVGVGGDTCEPMESDGSATLTISNAICNVKKEMSDYPSPYSNMHQAEDNSWSESIRKTPEDILEEPPRKRHCTSLGYDPDAEERITMSIANDVSTEITSPSPVEGPPTPHPSQATVRQARSDSFAGANNTEEAKIDNANSANTNGGMAWENSIRISSCWSSASEERSETPRRRQPSHSVVSERDQLKSELRWETVGEGAPIPVVERGGSRFVLSLDMASLLRGVDAFELMDALEQLELSIVPCSPEVGACFSKAGKTMEQCKRMVKLNMTLRATVKLLHMIVKEKRQQLQQDNMTAVSDQHSEKTQTPADKPEEECATTSTTERPYSRASTVSVKSETSLQSNPCALAEENSQTEPPNTAEVSDKPGKGKGNAENASPLFSLLTGRRNIPKEMRNSVASPNVSELPQSHAQNTQSASIHRLPTSSVQGLTTGQQRLPWDIRDGDRCNCRRCNSANVPEMCNNTISSNAAETRQSHVGNAHSMLGLPTKQQHRPSGSSPNMPRPQQGHARGPATPLVPTSHYSPPLPRGDTISAASPFDQRDMSPPNGAQPQGRSHVNNFQRAQAVYTSPSSQQQHVMRSRSSTERAGGPVGSLSQLAAVANREFSPPHPHALPSYSLHVDHSAFMPYTRTQPRDVAPTHHYQNQPVPGPRHQVEISYSVSAHGHGPGLTPPTPTHHQLWARHLTPPSPRDGPPPYSVHQHHNVPSAARQKGTDSQQPRHRRP